MPKNARSREPFTLRRSSEPPLTRQDRAEQRANQCPLTTAQIRAMGVLVSLEGKRYQASSLSAFYPTTRAALERLGFARRVPVDPLTFADAAAGRRYLYEATDAGVAAYLESIGRDRA